jgi:hypothetical protein
MPRGPRELLRSSAITLAAVMLLLLYLLVFHLRRAFFEKDKTDFSFLLLLKGWSSECYIFSLARLFCTLSSEGREVISVAAAVPPVSA